MDAKKLLKKRQTKQTMITERGAERNSFEQHIESACSNFWGSTYAQKVRIWGIFFQSFRKLRVEVHLKVLKLIFGDSTPNETMFVHINTPINKEDNIQSSSTPLVAVYRVKRRKTEAKVTVKWALLDTCNSNERLDMRKRNMPDIDMKLEDEVVLSPGSSTQLQPPSEKRQGGRKEFI